MAHLLVVDDEDHVLDTIRQLLERAGHTVTTASSGQEALDLMEHWRPDLTVLDIIMPGMSGLDVCQRIRANIFLARLPILFLTAKGRSSDVAQGLNLGGDDYLTKPFDIVELPARVNALLRRAPGGSLDSEGEYVSVGTLQVHRTRPYFMADGQLVELTVVQHRLLHYLVQNVGQPVSTEQLLENVWEYPPGTGDPSLVRSHITNLRAKLGQTAGSPHYIRNLHGHGYLIDE